MPYIYTPYYDYTLTIEHYNSEKELADSSAKGDDLTIEKTSRKVTSGVDGSSVEFNIALISAGVRKKVYEPNLIVATISITANSADKLPSLQQIRAMFLRKRASLKINYTMYKEGLKEDGSKEIDTQFKRTLSETGYFVYEISPVYSRSSLSTGINVVLYLYSLDKLMTIDKYSQAYLGRKLRKELIQSADRFELGYEYKDNNNQTQKDKTTVPVFNDREDVTAEIKSLVPEKDEKGEELKDDDGNVIMKEITISNQYNIDKLFLQHLAYDSYDSVPAEDGAKVEKYQKEFIQPYLVQYNESFYSFLVRVANRCGEFLYFEDGALHIGLSFNPSEKIDKTIVSDLDKEKIAIPANAITPTEVTDYQTLSFRNMGGNVLDVTDYSRDTIKDGNKFGDSKTSNHEAAGRLKGGTEYYKNSGEKKDFTVPNDVNFTTKDKEKVDHTYNYNLEYTNDEFYMPLYKDGYGGTKWSELNLGSPEKNWSKFVAQILGSTSLFQIITDGILEWGEMLATYLLYKKYYGERGRDKYTIPYSPTNDDNRYGTELNKEPGVVVPFSENEAKRWTTLEYYSDIRKYEEIQEKNMIEIDMDSNFTSFKLGEAIKVPYSKDIYIVCEVNINIDSESHKQTLKAIPLLGYYKSLTSSSPDYFVAFPPVSSEGVFRKSGPQTAFVVDTRDPKQQGRVRIRYPWQSDNKTIPDEILPVKDKDEVIENYNKIRKEAATPWIRMATPSASSKAGIYWEAEPGDEVWVNFENDNVERPCVVGALYSKSQLAPAAKGSRVMVSKYGHMIRFKDPYDGIGEYTDATGFARIMSSISPLYNTGCFFIPWVSDKLNFDNSVIDQMTGGIDIGDAYGLYKITMSSDDRSINITSPFGKVNLSAFTGITISAPNGDIKIAGKNVTINASNKVTITSGSNIPQGNYFKSGINSIDDFKDKMADFGLSLLSNVQPIDLSLLRNFLEIFIRPIDGTLNIKSHSFLRLEAGDGKAVIPKVNYTDWFLKTEDDNLEIYSTLSRTHRDIADVLDKISEIVETHKNEVYERVMSLQSMIINFAGEYVTTGYLDNLTNITDLINLIFADNAHTFTFENITLDGWPAIFNQLSTTIGRPPERDDYQIWVDKVNTHFQTLRNLIKPIQGGSIENIIDVDYLKEKIDKAFVNSHPDNITSSLRNALTAAFNSNDYLFGITKKMLNANDRKIFLDPNLNDPDNLRDMNQWESYKLYQKRDIFKKFLHELQPNLRYVDITFDNAADPSNMQNWSDSVANLTIRLKPNAALNKDKATRFLSYFTQDWTNGIGRAIWEKGTGVKGKILMSENKATTVSLDANGAFTTSDNKSELEMEAVAIAFEDKLKNKIRNLS